MVKIIGGKKYSTETARKLAEWDNGHYGHDFQSCSEELYRTKSGQYFIFGEGGPMSKYAQYDGNETSGSSHIIPIGEEQARVWAEEHVSGETYELIFGTVDDDAELLSMSIQITQDARTKLDTLKAQTGLNLSTLISAAINAYECK